MPRKQTLRVALTCWEPGRTGTGFGAKIGGLGAVMEELPEELIRCGDRRGIKLEVEILSPCFGHYDRSRLEDTGLRMPAVLDGSSFDFTVYRLQLTDRLTMVYFWDDWQLNWTHARAIYPDDPEVGFKLFATVSQAMAGYIRSRGFHTVHGHDYHVALVPFYLGDDYLAAAPHHLTIHNASYQGIYPVDGKGYERLNRINLPGERLFHKYFDFFDNLNFLKAAMIRTHETGGKVTTVSGDLEATWGYAAELRQSAEELYRHAQALKPWAPVGEVFVPNRHLDTFQHIPILGITNGLAERNWPQHLPELKAERLRTLQERQPRGVPLFRHPAVQEAMLSRDHSFDPDHLEVKAELKRLLHLEAFGTEPEGDPILLTVVGRLVEQKNFALVADTAERVLQYDGGIKFVILASAPEGDAEGKRTEARFRWLAWKYPQRFFFSSDFNLPLSRLILAGGDFTLIPSRFEPCGLVDYEASLLGTIVIAHRTGGLAKIAGCGYLYDWLDLSDPAGEAEAFFQQIAAAVRTYRLDPGRHRELILKAMAIDASWAKSAETYLALYRYGILVKEWHRRQERMLGEVDAFARELAERDPDFARFFHPRSGDSLDVRLAAGLRRRPEAVSAAEVEPAASGAARQVTRRGRTRSSAAGHGKAAAQKRPARGRRAASGRRSGPGSRPGQETETERNV